MLADAVAKRQIMLLMETGQETPEELRQLLEHLNHPGIGVNFDPANIILYNTGNPITAVEILKPWIKHVHIKDAIRTKKDGAWGKTVVWGNGQVGRDNFLLSLKRIGFTGALAIETRTNSSFKNINLTLNRLAEFSIKVKSKAEKQTNFYSYQSNKT